MTTPACSGEKTGIVIPCDVDEEIAAAVLPSTKLVTMRCLSILPGHLPDSFWSRRLRCASGLNGWGFCVARFRGNGHCSSNGESFFKETVKC